MKKNNLLNLLTLWTFAVAGPLFKVLQAGGELFVNYSTTRFELLLTILLVVFIIPLILFLINLSLAKIHKLFAQIYLLIIYSILITAGLLIIFKNILTWNANNLILLSSITSVVLSMLLLNVQGLQKLLKLLWPLTIISVGLFLVSPKIRSIFANNAVIKLDLENSKANSTNVAVLILDEFSLSGLLDLDGNIIKERYPNFYQLSQESNWYKNASTVSVFTPIAVPSILTGLFPKSKELLPIVQEYPINLFTILANSHDFYISEPFTKLCPLGLLKDQEDKPYINLIYDLAAIYLNILVPEDYSSFIPSIEGKWGDYWSESKSKNNKRWRPPKTNRESRIGRFRSALAKWRSTKDRPALYFNHLLLPHIPLDFMPSGRIYQDQGLPEVVKHQWIKTDEAALAKVYHRYLMQIGAVDKMLGEFISRLKELGVYDNTLLVVVADHGISFKAGNYRRGDSTREDFLDDVMRVPLFIKLPHQKTGQTSLKNAEVIDILPTITSELGIKSKEFKFDGSSLLFDSQRSTKKVFLFKHKFSPGVSKKVLDNGLSEYPFIETYPSESLAWKKDLQKYYTSIPEEPFYMGIVDPLLGQKIDPSSLSKIENLELVFNDWQKNASEFTYEFTPADDRVPTWISGSFKSKASCQEQKIFLVLNDKIIHVSKAYKIDQQYRFSTIISDQYFKNATNILSFYYLPEACLK